MLDEALTRWQALEGDKKSTIRFHHVSTDEVYGSLGDTGSFSETTPFAPNSPYAASKAASDHLIRAYNHTHGLPTTITNCSNNYGPFQFPEKLIPVVLMNALQGKTIPVYGDGLNIRDWLYVGDHCDAIIDVLAKGAPGETYNVGGNCERTNLDLLAAIFEAIRAEKDLINEHTDFDTTIEYESLIDFVKDRPGHDRRYAVNTSKILKELNWAPKEELVSGLRKTVQWYVTNMDWCSEVTDGKINLGRQGLKKKATS